MNSPFFRNYNRRYVPVQQSEQRSSPKVISVPVHFISFSMLKDSSALKIQRVLRGFLVRKSVKKIASIRNEVTKIEQRIKDIEVVNLIRRDAKERLRVNESLMSLLFKLDSIRGVDSGIRDLRKAVTRKAKVDSIAQADHQTLDSANNDSGEIDLHRNSSTHATETSGNLEAVEEDGDGGIVKEVAKEIVEDSNHMKTVDGCGAEEGMNEIGTEDRECDEGNQCDGGNEEKGSREVLADNEKMMELMMRISEMQTRMINSLSRRVEQLEKSFIADKLKRNNKTRTAFRRKDKYGFCTDFV